MYRSYILKREYRSLKALKMSLHLLSRRYNNISYSLDQERCETNENTMDTKKIFTIYKIKYEMLLKNTKCGVHFELK